MRRFSFLFTPLLLLITVALYGSASAQSSDRDHPIQLNSAELSGNMNDHKRENFYSFTAGPGELTITLDVKANRDEQGVLNFDLLARNGATSLACCYFAQGNGGGTGREVATVKLERRQIVLLHTTNGDIGGGTFRIRLTGATTLSGANGGGGYNRDNDNAAGRGDSDNEPGRGNRNRGETVDVPATGILHIRMKDGTVRDIDLGRVRDISIREH